MRPTRPKARRFRAHGGFVLPNPACSSCWLRFAIRLASQVGFVLPVSSRNRTPGPVLVDEPTSIKVVRKNGDFLVIIAVTFFSTFQMIALCELTRCQGIIRPRRLLGSRRNAAAHSVQKAFGFSTASCMRLPTGKVWPVQAHGDSDST
jgi:hypothetical protein